MLADQESEVRKACRTLHLKSGIYVESMLKQYRWNSEKLIRDYGEHGLEYMFDRCGLKKHAGNEEEESEEDIGMCDACYTDDVQLVAYDICSHKFCTSCWKEYIRSNVDSTLNDLNVKCMDYGCKCYLTESFMLSFFNRNDDKALFERFYKTKVDSYVGSNFRLKWCPNPKCVPLCIKKLCDENLYYVQCKCGEECCFHCDQEPHFPSTCAMYEKFVRMSKEDAASVQLIKKTSQQCPSCKTFVFKNVGCDHINCHCGKEFCYRCGGDFTGYKHDYDACYRHEAKNVQLTEIETDFSLVEGLFMQFSSGWNKHREWLEEEKKVGHYRLMLENLKPLLKSTPNFAFNDDDVKFLINSFRTVLRSRRLLRSCYVFAFMYFGFDKMKMERSSVQNKEPLKKEIAALETYGLLFESHLSRLESFVAQLLAGLDKSVVHCTKTSFLEMINRTDLVNKEQQNIVEFINTRLEMNDMH